MKKTITKEVAQTEQQKKFKFMHFQDIPTSELDFKKKEKEWLGFDYALEKIGLTKKRVLDHIRKGIPVYQDKGAQENRRKREFEHLKKSQNQQETPKEQVTVATTAKSKVKKPSEETDESRKEKPNKSQSSKASQSTEEVSECQDQCQKLYRLGNDYEACGNRCKVEGKHRLEECRCKSHLIPKETSKVEQRNQEEKSTKESRLRYTPEEEKKIKQVYDKAQELAQKATADYEQMLKDKKKQLKPIKGITEDSPSDNKNTTRGQGEDSSSSEVPKRRNRQARINVVRLKTAIQVAEERAGRTVLTEKGEDDPTDVPTATPDEVRSTAEIEETRDGARIEVEVVEEVPGEEVPGIYATESARIEESVERFWRFKQ